MSNDVYILRNFPIGPTDNHMFITLRNGRRILSPQNRAYKLECQKWGWRNQKELDALYRMIHEPMPLQMDIMLKMQRSRFYTLKGGIKKMDASNRLKASVDEVCKLLKMDDSVIFSLSITKQVSIEEGLDFYIQIKAPLIQ